MNLIGNTDKKEILNAVPPQSTHSYTAVGHGWINEKLHEELDKLNLKVEESKFSANESRTQMVAQLMLSNGFTSTEDVHSPSITYRNSYDKTKNFSVGSGAIIKVCSNGMMAQRDVVNFSRKHTGNAHKDIIEMIQQSVSGVKDTFFTFKERIEQLEQIFMSKEYVGKLLGRLYFNEGILNPTQLNETKKQYFSNPNFHALNEYNETNAYRFYNNVTEALKSSHPSQYIEKHTKFNSFIEKELAA